MDVERRDTINVELNRLMEKRSSREIDADELLSPKHIAEMAEAKYGATRELLSQMVKDGQIKILGRGAYALPENLQNSADNADFLTTGASNVSLSGLSGDSRKEESPLSA